MLDNIVAVCTVIIAVALTVLAVFTVPAAYRFRATYKKVDELLDRVSQDINPIVAQTRIITDNLKSITTTIRTDVDQVSRTVNHANERLQDAIDGTEARVKEFNGLLEVVQQEAEDAFISTAATVRGIRTGAEAFRDLRDHGGPDFASDELDPAELADEIERQLESQEVGDGYNGSPEPSAEALSAAPRVRPRARGQRRTG